ncbi:UAA-domain-containing protein [Lentinus tigrinus ALCF2SS1-7]|uniref:UAA-domain-containing protein n=1 Tax=Lentinus tigrinus ALCF2SS1-6 TaxID=1328759 RepID=A0A5C2SML2_9APHY|nr:UAA-domain-containing protein [Lentinus tigrinus ALCF2SS1-6]RPD76538.1 UAA-domain-containing protein [Lentinus tigrinus ALCF2SS1-7]
MARQAKNGQLKAKHSIKEEASSSGTAKAGGKKLEKMQENGNANVSKAIALSLVDYSLMLSLVFGGCCSNVWSYEQLLKMDAHIGTTLTFSQMLFITLQSLPSFLVFPAGGGLPRLKPRHVPLSSWALQVVVLTSGSLMNNWVFAFSVPLTVQIVFRSAGLAVSMLLGYLVMKKRYSLAQIAAVAFVSAGVILATLSRPSSPKSSEVPVDLGRYTIGVAMLTLSLFLTGTLGVLQERTYTKYGPHWKEGVFYTHCLSLPIFLLFTSDLKRGFRGLASPASIAPFSKEALGGFTPYIPYAVLVANMFTQLACVSGVNQLSSHVSSVSTNLVLTARKAISLCFSVWWFGNEWNAQLGIGAGMVFIGSLFYTAATSRRSTRKAKAE